MAKRFPANSIHLMATVQESKAGGAIWPQSSGSTDGVRISDSWLATASPASPSTAA
jgi:hypothetical protein